MHATWKDWYNVFHVLVVHVGTSWHPTLLNVMHVISVCIPPAPLVVFVRGVPRGSPCLLTLISVSLTSLDATAVVERGWSSVNYLKGLNRTRLQAATVEDYLLCKLLRGVAPHFGAPSLAASFIQTSSTAATEEEQTEEVEDEGQRGKGEEGDEEEEEDEEDVVWLLGRAHDGLRTREREGSEWPQDF